MNLKEYQYLWQEESIYYAERVSRYGYVITTRPQEAGEDRKVLIIEDDEVYKAVIQKMLDAGRGVDCGRWKEDECAEQPITTQGGLMELAEMEYALEKKGIVSRIEPESPYPLYRCCRERVWKE